MSVRITSGYLFNGNGFLDARQGIATSLDDLRNWDFNSIIIPNGFEVCVKGEWYTYGEDNEFDALTGKFRQRSVGEGSGSGSINVPTAGIVMVGKTIGGVKMTEGYESKLDDYFK